MSPAIRQRKTRHLANKAFVARVTVAADDAAFSPRKFIDDDAAGTTLIEHVMHHLRTVKNPQIPAAPYLALDFGEHRPAGLIGVPVILRAQVLQQGCINGLE